MCTQKFLSCTPSLNFPTDLDFNYTKSASKVNLDQNHDIFTLKNEASASHCNFIHYPTNFSSMSRLYMLPSTNGKTHYVSISFDSSQNHEKSSNAVIMLHCFNIFDLVNSIFDVPLTGAYIVTGICSGEGPCLYLSTFTGVFEFQCSAAQQGEKTLENDYFLWLSRMVVLKVKMVSISSLFSISKIHYNSGGGCFTKIFEAKHCYTSQPLVLKAIPKKNSHVSLNHHESTGPSEINILRILDHSYIVKLQTAFQDDVFYYLALEYLPGYNLYRWLQRYGFFSENQARAVMVRVFSALAYLESQGIIHRDIKLENLVLHDPNDPSSVKLIDFGLSTFLNTPRSRMRCGSPGYVAPEIISKQTYGSSADVFSAGVVLYCLLTGTAPFYSHGDSPSTTLYKNQKCQIYYDPVVWKNISINARDLISKLLEKNPLKRYSASQALMHTWLLGSIKCLSFKRVTSKTDSKLHERNSEGLFFQKQSHEKPHVDTCEPMRFVFRSSIPTSRPSRYTCLKFGLPTNKKQYIQTEFKMETSVTRIPLLQRDCQRFSFF
ncbi:probable serine/threonine-protein kinase 2 isoform X2 [Hylaeus volcanicus]|uniref:probable serine/threonine-protein kinase 2 isoform X2 n=1 Tax=Hylaeus volcanicus TaxID=313075 RepID=UPI0023B851A9|nr:probable serine/threonine-protein kinase 2 isoform X2 [Hylaeus volcanicus]